MKPADFIVRIPEPCHEDWNQMQPDAKGKFCSSCSKSVFDFSNKTDLEIKTILIEHKDQKVCGHFKKTQIDRPLSLTVRPDNLPYHVSITKTFAIALFLVFGSMLFSCKDEKGNDIPVKVESPEMVAGMIMAPVPPSPLEDSLSSCDMLTGEVPVDNTGMGYATEEMVNGGIGFEEGHGVEPPPLKVIDPPEVVMVGMIAYEPPLVNDSVVDSPVIDSNLVNEEAKRLAESTTLNHDKIFSVYPNPSTGEFTIAYDLLRRSDVKIAIYNMNGALVKAVTDTKSQYEGRYRLPVNLNELPNGIYIVSLIHGDKQSVERLVIAR